MIELNDDRFIFLFLDECHRLRPQVRLMTRRRLQIKIWQINRREHQLAVAR
jgi:hypothetical protein